MSDILSQEEIDALLKGSSAADDNKLELIAEEKEALSEICELSMNEISNFMLSKIKNKVSIKIKDLSYLESNDLLNAADEWFSFYIDFKEGIEDKTLFLFKLNDVNVINDLLIGGDGTLSDNIEQVQSDVLLAVLKDAIPLSNEAISNVLGTTVTSTSPEVFQTGADNDNLKEVINECRMVKISYSVEIGNVINSELIQLIPVSMSKKLVDLLLHTMENADEDTYVEQPIAVQPKVEKKQANKKIEKSQPVVIQSVSFPNFDNDSSPTYDENIDFILDVSLKISVELGSTTKTIKEILSTNVGSIIELNRMAEDYVDILVNGKLIAKGEVIVVEENFGVRIMELYTNNRDFLKKD